MSDMDDRDISGESAVPLIPQPHGGALRRGGSPGRPRGTAQANVQAYIRSHLFADQAQDRIGIIDVLIAGAMKGDARKIELCLWYGIGKPTETVDLTIAVRQAASRLAEQLGIDDSLVQGQVDALIGGKR